MRVRKADWSVAVIDEKPFGWTCALRGCDPKTMLIAGAAVIDAQRRMSPNGVGPHADEVINLFGLAIRNGLTADDLKSTIFGYPTGASDIGSML